MPQESAAAPVRAGGRPHDIDGLWVARPSKLSRLYTLSAENIAAFRAAPDSAILPDFHTFLQDYTDCDDPASEIEAKCVCAFSNSRKKRNKINTQLRGRVA